MLAKEIWILLEDERGRPGGGSVGLGDSLPRKQYLYV